MNITQYRALKAEEASQKAEQTQTPTVPTQPTTPPITPPVEPKPPEKPPEDKPVVPEKLTIEGVGEVTLDELKNGYLRQSDYTKKTQEVARQRNEVKDAVTLFEQIKQNPQIAQQLSNAKVNVPPVLDPTQKQIIELNDKVYDMMLQLEIKDLQLKYPDFEVREVLSYADKKGLTNIEDAYKLLKSDKPQTSQSVDGETLKKQIRDEVLREIEAERTATQTIIRTNDGTSMTQSTTPTLSQTEKLVAQKMRLSEDEYLKWRDAGKRPKK